MPGQLTPVAHTVVEGRDRQSDTHTSPTMREESPLPLVLQTIQSAPSYTLPKQDSNLSLSKVHSNILTN